MAIRIRHIVLTWIVVILATNLIPHEYRATHPDTAFAGFPFEAIHWRVGDITHVSIGAIALNCVVWTTPFALAIVFILSLRRGAK